MPEAVAAKKQIGDDEFDIHGSLATQEKDDSFVVLYDSAEEKKGTAEPAPPSLENLNEEQFRAASVSSQGHPEDSYIDDILSSDDIEQVTPVAGPQEGDIDDDGPIALTNEELDGILRMGPATEEEFHPDFPVASESAALTPPPFPEDTEVEGFASPEMDESKPDQGGHGATSAVAPNVELDDEELPIALSDEDLDEILLEEEGGELPLPSTDHSDDQATQEPAHAETTVTADAGLTEEEPIALSDDELDHILADAEASHTEPAPELIPETQDEILTLDNEPELTLSDDVDSPPEAGAEGIQPQEQTESAGFFDSDEDEPITLSDEELDSILSTAPEEKADSDEIQLAEGMQQESRVVEDEEPIALSHEELDGILMDANETRVEEEIPTTEEAPAPADSKGFFDSDEDEPITLSADELEGITATATPEADASEQAEPSANMDQMAEPVGDAEVAARAAEEEGEKAEATEADEDDGPIALTADELDGIAAAAHEVTPEAHMVGLSPLDATPSAPSLAEQQKDKPATVFEEDLEAATLIHEDDQAKAPTAAPLPDAEELKSIMAYLDNLLGELPDDVIEKFAQSEYFKLYQKIMDKLGL